MIRLFRLYRWVRSLFKRDAPPTPVHRITGKKCYCGNNLIDVGVGRGSIWYMCEGCGDPKWECDCHSPSERVLEYEKGAK